MSTDEAKSQRGPWYLLFGLTIGLGLGLLISWGIAPVTYTDTAPVSLQTQFKDQYRLMIARAYQANGDVGRAQSRLALLGDPDPGAALLAQADRLLVAGDPDQAAAALLALAEALGEPVVYPTAAATSTPTAAATAPPGGRPTPTRRPTSTPTAVFSPTPRPTPTPTPTLGAYFTVIVQEEVCNPALTPGLLQIEVQDASRQPIAGMEIIVTWPGGQERLFTGLKPELGNGYADFRMAPGVPYAVRLLPDSVPAASDLRAPTCIADGSSFTGGLRLLLRQP